MAGILGSFVQQFKEGKSEKENAIETIRTRLMNLANMNRQIQERNAQVALDDAANTISNFYTVRDMPDEQWNGIIDQTNKARSVFGLGPTQLNRTDILRRELDKDIEDARTEGLKNNTPLELLDFVISPIEQKHSWLARDLAKNISSTLDAPSTPEATPAAPLPSAPGESQMAPPMVITPTAPVQGLSMHSYIRSMLEPAYSRTKIFTAKDEDDARIAFESIAKSAANPRHALPLLNDWNIIRAKLGKPPVDSNLAKGFGVNLDLFHYFEMEDRILSNQNTTLEDKNREISVLWADYDKRMAEKTGSEGIGTGTTPAPAAPTAATKGMIKPGTMAVTDSAYPFNINGQVVLIPGTDGGKQLNSDEARALYKKTGRHLGVFDSVESAKAYFDSAHGQPLAAPTPATSPPGTPPGIPGLGMPKGSPNAPGGHTFGKPPEKAKTPEQKTSEYERLLDDVTNARFDVLPDEQKQKVLKALSASQAEVHPEIGGWPMTKDGKGKWKYILPADLTDTEAKKLGLQIQRAEIASSNAAARAANTQAAAAARTAKAEEQSLKQDEIRKTQDQIQSLRENQEALRYAKFSPNIRRFFNKLSPDEQKRSRELGRQIDQARSHLNKLLTHEAVTSSNQDQKTDQLLRQKGQ